MDEIDMNHKLHFLHKATHITFSSVLQGPQGFQGSAGEAGEPGPAVSITHGLNPCHKRLLIMKSKTNHCT